MTDNINADKVAAIIAGTVAGTADITARVYTGRRSCREPGRTIAAGTIACLITSINAGNTINTIADIIVCISTDIICGITATITANRIADIIAVSIAGIIGNIIIAFGDIVYYKCCC